MSIPENRPPRVVLVHLPGSLERKHGEAYQHPFISQTARLPSCHGPACVPSHASRNRFFFVATRQSLTARSLDVGCASRRPCYRTRLSFAALSRDRFPGSPSGKRSRESAAKESRV